MFANLRPLLEWQLRFQSRRIGTWVQGGLYVLFVYGFICLVSAASPWTAGVNALRLLQTGHALFAIASAMRLAGQAVDDKLSGTLGFLKIANLSSRDWVAFRIVAAIVYFGPIWVLRMPAYMLVFSLGITLEQILWLEAVQAACFITVYCTALLVARYSTTGTAVSITTVLLLGFAQIVFYLPLFGIALACLIFDRPFHSDDYPWAQAIGRLSVLRYFWTMPLNEIDWALAATSLALHLAAAAFVVRLLARVIYFGVGTETTTDEPASSKADRRSTSRPSRRVWDDALAWQVCHVHCGQSLRARSTTAFFAAIGVAIVCMVVNDAVGSTIIIGAACGLTLIILAFKASDCFSRELKQGTLSTLALLPLDGPDIFDAWNRGARRLARSAWITVAIGAAALLVLAPDRAPLGYIVFAFTILILPEAAFLSNVIARKVTFLDFDFEQLFVNLWSLFVIGMVLAIGFIVALNIHPWLGFGIFLALSFLARKILLLDLAGHMAHRIEMEQ